MLLGFSARPQKSTIYFASEQDVSYSPNYFEREEV